MERLIEWLFGCHHELSFVWTIKGRTYKTCTKCGKVFDYDLKTMKVA